MRALRTEGWDRNARIARGERNTRCDSRCGLLVLTGIPQAPALVGLEIAVCFNQSGTQYGRRSSLFKLSTEIVSLSSSGFQVEDQVFHVEPKLAESVLDEI